MEWSQLATINKIIINMKTLLSLCVMMLFCGFRLFAEDEKVLLKTEIPSPPITISEYMAPHTNNMEPYPKKREFFVPVGTTNLALHKPITASCQATVGNLAMITDGDKEGDDGSWMELAAGKQWVQIDLQHSSEIYAVVVWHYYYKSWVYLNVVVAVSDDSEFKKDVKVVFNNDIEDSIGFGKGSDRNYYESYMGKLVDAKGVKGRYVRLYSNGNTLNRMNRYIEVEIFGKP